VLEEVLIKVGKLRWLPIRHWFDLRQAMGLRVRVRDPEDGIRYKFVADSLHSYQRARSHLDKEPDTTAWLRSNLRTNDVFLDIGANVGTFSLFAAKHISGSGHVYACEPHMPTAVQLLQNVALNELTDRVSVLSVAVAGEDGFIPFRYKRWRQGASGSQLEANGGVEMDKFVGIELKTAMRVDTMIERGAIRPPNLVKIDTDGLELPIVSGMSALLRSEKRPRSVLVEIQVGELTRQNAQMQSLGYALKAHHVVGKWERLARRGVPLEQLAFNGIYEPI
jgi:FkbM family methyltransferase